MPDVYAAVTELDAATQARLIQVLETRGADLLRAAGQIGDALAAALKAEARRRVDVGAFFGQIAYASLIARKPHWAERAHTLRKERTR
jgi:hypothetical protein